MALQFAIKLYWNAAKYARNIKCRLGYLTLSADGGICPEMYNTTITEWKSYLYKAAYHDVNSMRKVSLRMNIPVQVRMYMTDAIVNSPRLVCIRVIAILRRNFLGVIDPLWITGGPYQRHGHHRITRQLGQHVFKTC